jgi:hypothetical protein
MDRQQAGFRLRGELQKLVERASAAISRPQWNRRELLVQMRELPDEPEWMSARSALERGHIIDAQRALGRYFAARQSAFPLNALDVPKRVHAILRRFPSAAQTAAERADALARGEFDLLGYRQIRIGQTVDWHADPIVGRRPPMRHWASVPYLDPAYGDHKVIWEINRHQHWLALGRAYALTGSRTYYDVFCRQLSSWMESNPPTLGINWASMLELAFRTISWLWAAGFFSAAAAQDDYSPRPWLIDTLLGIDRQLRHVERNLSLYFSPNTHLTGEALALYVAGCALPELGASARWADVGREVLLHEAQAQVLPDGGHAELSAHYHRYSTEFYLLALTVARSAGDRAAPAFEQAARKQAHYLRTITDDHGRRPATGDDDGGQLFPVCGRAVDDCSDTLAIAAVLLGEPDLALATAPEEAFWWCGEGASELRPSHRARSRQSTALRESGYYVSRTNRGDYLLLDAGQHGFLNAGHAHADALSIVLTVAGQPLIIDPGTATYTMDPEMRDRFRSTPMHNTLVLDGQPQSRPAGPFHWKTRTDARARLWRSTPAGGSDGADYVEAAHDAYAPRQHVRSVLAIDEVGWWIVDTVLGDGTADAVTYWHLHPAWGASLRHDSVRLRHREGATSGFSSGGTLEVTPPGESALAFWSPEYGRIEPAPVIAVRNRGPLPLVAATFIPAHGWYARGLSVRRLPVEAAPRGWVGSRWQAKWNGGEVSLLIAVAGMDVQAESWSPRSWGTTDLRTDGRIAAVVRIPGRDSAVVIDGSVVREANTSILAAQLPIEILRVSVANMAPLVHEQHPAGARVN